MLPDALTGQIIDLKEKRDHEEYRKRVADRNQRLASIAKTHPTAFTDPKILADHVAQAEEREGRA